MVGRSEEVPLSRLEEMGSKVVQISCLRSLGYAHRELGELEQSTSCLRRGLDIARELCDAPDEADMYVELGNTHLAAGDPDATRNAWQQALDIFERLDHPDTHGLRSKLDSLQVREDIS